MINTSNPTSKNKPPWLSVQPWQPPAATGAPTRIASGRRRSRSGRAARVSTLLAVLVSWLAAIPRRVGGRLFAMNDAEAYWRSWLITRTRGGLGRRYRDPRFDALTECPKCRGAGATADRPCPPCLGTGRVTPGEAS